MSAVLIVLLAMTVAADPLFRQPSAVQTGLNVINLDAGSEYNGRVTIMDIGTR